MKTIKTPYLKHDKAIEKVLDLLENGSKTTKELSEEMGKTYATIRDYLSYNPKVIRKKIKGIFHYFLKVNCRYCKNGFPIDEMVKLEFTNGLIDYSCHKCLVIKK